MWIQINIMTLWHVWICKTWNNNNQISQICGWSPCFLFKLHHIKLFLSFIKLKKLSYEKLNESLMKALKSYKAMKALWKAFIKLFFMYLYHYPWVHSFIYQEAVLCDQHLLWLLIIWHVNQFKPSTDWTPQYFLISSSLVMNKSFL